MARNSEELIESLVAELQPAEPLRLARGMKMALLSLGAGAGAMILMFGLRPDFLAGHPDPMALVGAGLFLVLALATSWAVVDMARPYVGIRRDGWGWTALMAAMLPAASLVLMITNRLGGEGSGLEMDGQQCLQYGLALGLFTALALTVWLRRGAPSLPGRAGMLTGVAAGSAGIFAVSLFCPHNELIHIGIWHGLTVIVAGLAGRLVIPRLIAW